MLPSLYMHKRAGLDVEGLSMSNYIDVNINLQFVYIYMSIFESSVTVYSNSTSLWCSNAIVLQFTFRSLWLRATMPF